MSLDRRDFLVKSAFLFFGSLFGLNGLSKAFASVEVKRDLFPRPCIALIIDDIGFSRSRAKGFLDLGIPITFSILPQLPKSYDLATEIHGEGQEVMLHQPMEPRDPCLDPGPGALYVKDRSEKIITIMDENISGLPFAVGVNNHMGSRFTERQTKIREALVVIKDRGLFFIDSLTSDHSIAYRTARGLDLIAARRNLFLDNRPDESYILSQLYHLRNHARTHGYAIGIGHPFPETSRAIRHFLTGLKGSGISWVHASTVLKA
ncbi:MAG: divergent polysaccharide deacetylase family protein [Pseudomonadota bacterium]